MFRKFIIGTSLLLPSSLLFANNIHKHHFKKSYHHVFETENNILNKRITFMNSPDVNERLSKIEFLNLLLTGQYGITIKIEDKKSKEILNQKMPYLILKRTKLKNVLKKVLGDDLFYTFNEKTKTLDIKYFNTETFNLDFINNIRTGSSSLSTDNSKLENNYKFDFWDKLKKDIVTILKNIDSKDYKVPVIDSTAGLITVTGNKQQLRFVHNYIKRLVQRLTKEVMIDVRIYSVQLNKQNQTGINWQNLSLSLGSEANGTPNPISVSARMRNLFGSTSVFNSTMFNISGFLNFLEHNGKVSSISNPKIVTLNNQKAIISVGDTIYYKYASAVVTDQNGNPQTQYTIDSKFIGIVLDITPEITQNNEIILTISPKITGFRDPAQLNNPSRDMPPDITEKSLNTVVKLKSGQTLVLGGIITNSDSFTHNGIPVLQEIPILGNMFESKSELSSRKELVFVITPRIIDLNKVIPIKKVLYFKGNK